MDEETRHQFERLEKKLDAQAEKFPCPQDGCRFMESKSSRVGGIANILTSIMLAAYILFEILSGGAS